MKKKILGILICGILILGIAGCSNNVRDVSILELRELQEQITTKVSEQDDYNNFASCSVDEDNKVVVVELIDNSEEQQEWFKKNILDSNYIKFKQGGPYFTTSNAECLENILGGYITSEKIIPKEISLNDIIKVDAEKIEYSKVKITDNGLIYAIIKTNDENIIKTVDDYFTKKYNGYKKTKFDNNYLIYVYNKNTDFNLDNDLKVCK